jgi:hypothetical protein
MKFQFIERQFDIMLKATSLNSLYKKFYTRNNISEWIMSLPTVAEDIKKFTLFRTLSLCLDLEPRRIVTFHIASSI